MSTNFVQKATGASPSGLADSLIFDDGTSVGIGTTTPTLGQLHVKNAAGHCLVALQSADAAQAELRIRRATGDAGWSIYKPASSLDLRFWDGADRVTFQSGGNVGIGTTSPAAKLHVSGSNPVLRLTGQPSGNWSGIQFENSGLPSNPLRWALYTGTSGQPGPSISFFDYVSLSDRLTIDSSGNVGIGTNTPDARLHVNTTTQGAVALHVSSPDESIIRFDGGNNLRLEVLGSDSTLVLGRYSGDPTDPRIDLYASSHGSGLTDFDCRIVAPGQEWAGTGNGVLRFLARIAEIRYLGTEETRRSFRLRLDDSSSGNDPRYTGIVSLNKNDGGKTMLEFAVDAAELQPGQGIKMRLDQDGVLYIGDGIGSGARVLKFSESGGSSLVQHEAGGGLLLCTDNSNLSPGNGVRVRIDKTALSANSALYTASDGKTLTTTAPSAREYKRDIEEFVPDVSRLFDLRLKSFTWKSTGEADCGFLAEDIESYIPELFRRGETVTGWKADRFPFYLFQALKDLNRRVAAIESATRT